MEQRRSRGLKMEKSPTVRPAEIMKLPCGRLAVRWEGKTEFEPIDDPDIAALLVFMIVKGPEYSTGKVTAA